MEITNFIFDGRSLADIDMIPASISTDNQSMTPATLDFITTETPTARVKRFVASNYSNTITFELGITLDPCVHRDDITISPELDRYIRRWLIREDGFKKMYFEQGDYCEYWVNCYLNLTPMYAFGLLIGYIITGTTDSPYMNTMDYSAEFDLLANNTYKILATSDDIGYVYPKIELTFSTSFDDDLTFGIVEDSELLGYAEITGGVSAGTTITLDSDRSIIEGLTSDNEWNWKFPRLIQDWDDTYNTFTIDHDCHVKITYTPRRKVIL